MRAAFCRSLHSCRVARGPTIRDLRIEDLPYIEGLSRYADRDEDFGYTLSLEQEGVLGSRNTQRFLGRSVIRYLTEKGIGREEVRENGP